MAEAAQLSSERITTSRSKFYPFMAGLLLLIVLAGFTRTLYLRPLFDVQVVPPYLLVHGALLTAWYVLFFLQTVLVANGSVTRHRELGIAAVAIGATIPLAGLMATFGVFHRNVITPEQLEENIEFATAVIIGNLHSLVLFSAAVLSAFLLRHKREFHRRFMLWGTIFIIGPALSRIYGWSIMPDVGEILFDMTVMSVLMAVIAAHELWTQKRLHVATMIASGSWIGWLLLQPSILSSEWARNFVRSLA